MPERDPTIWNYLTLLPEPIKAALAGFVVALLRIAYDDKEPRIVRRLLESCLCGVIALCVATLAEAVGLEAGIATFAGGAVGLIGADQVREWARKVGERQILKGAADDVQ